MTRRGFRRFAFSLIELLIALSIMVLLLGVAAPRGLAWRRSASIQRAVADVSELLTHARTYSRATCLPYRIECEPATGLFVGSRAAAEPGAKSSVWVEDRRIRLEPATRVREPSVATVWVVDGEAAWRTADEAGAVEIRVESANGETSIQRWIVLPPGRGLSVYSRPGASP